MTSMVHNVSAFAEEDAKINVTFTPDGTHDMWPIRVQIKLGVGSLDVFASPGAAERLRDALTDALTSARAEVLAS